MQRKAASVAPIIALALAGAALTSCSAPQQQASVTQEPASAAPAVTTDPPTPTETPTPTMAATNIGADYTPFGHFLIKSRGAERDWVDVPTEFYVVGTGPVTVAASTLLPGKEITAEAYTSVGTEAKPMIAGAVEYRAPASGLEPEKYVTVLLAIDPATADAVKQTEVLRQDTKNHPQNLTGSRTGTEVAFSVYTGISDAPGKTMAYDVMSGKKLWERNGFGHANVFGALTIMGDGKPVAGGKCPRATGVDVATGRDLFSVDFSDLNPADCGRPAIGSSAFGTFDPGMSEKLLYVRISGSTSKPSAFNAITGAPVQLPAGLLAADPRSSLVVGQPSGTQDPKPFIVTDAATGDVKYTLDAARVGKLQASVDSLYAGKLYLKTTDQHPVVDVATGKTIIDNAPRYPVGAVDSWTYWSDGTLDKTS